MVWLSFLHYTSLCISCDKNLGEFLMLCFVLWALCCSLLSIKVYVCTWVDLLFVNIYSIFCAWPRDQHPNVILSQDSQMAVLKFPKLRLSRLWGPIILCADLWLRWGLKQNCIPLWELSNDMWHTTYTQGNWGDSRVLLVGSQIANLIPSPSFGHNLCLKCSNESCKPILHIYVLRSF